MLVLIADFQFSEPLRGGPTGAISRAHIIYEGPLKLTVTATMNSQKMAFRLAINKIIIKV